MKLNIQKKIAARLLGISPKRIKFDPLSGDEIKEAITRKDISSLINKGIIKVKKKKGVSKARSMKIKRQKKKGRRKGEGSRKGKITARYPRKRKWIEHVRAQRELIKKLKEQGRISKKTHALLYKKIKGGTFRSKSHIMLFIKENKLIEEKNKKIKKNK